MKIGLAILGIVLFISFLVFAILASRDYSDMEFSILEPEDRECVYVRPGQWMCKPETPEGVSP